MKNRTIKATIVVGILSVFFSCTKEVSPIPSAQKNTNTVNPATPPLVTSFTFQEDTDSIQTADSAYWYYKPSNGCAYMLAFKGTKKIRLFLSTCGNDPLVSGEKGDDDISGGFQYTNGTDQYGIAGYHSYNITVDNTNSVSGSFNLNIRAYPNNTISSIARLKATFSNIPFHP